MSRRKKNLFFGYVFLVWLPIAITCGILHHEGRLIARVAADGVWKIRMGQPDDGTFPESIHYRTSLIVSQSLERPHPEPEQQVEFQRHRCDQWEDDQSSGSIDRQMALRYRLCGRLPRTAVESEVGVECVK
jgi:hypothetical protein